MAEQHEIGSDYKKLLEIYDQINEADDITYKMAAFLTIDNYYTYGLKIANEVNDRQGKNRATISYNTTRLMGYSLEDDVDVLLDAKLNQLFIDILNTYLSDKQELPVNKPRIAQGIVSRVKALLIMLVSTNQYGVIPLLNIPRYVLNSTAKLFENIQEVKNDILNNWIKWLEEHDNYEMAEIVRRKGNEFWGSEGLKANVPYDNAFGGMQDRIRHPEETYNAYKGFRAQYRKTVKDMLPSMIYDIFEITPDAYRRAREAVYNEISELFSGDEYASAVRKLIFES